MYHDLHHIDAAPRRWPPICNSTNAGHIALGTRSYTGSPSSKPLWARDFKLERARDKGTPKVCTKPGMLHTDLIPEHADSRGPGCACLERYQPLTLGLGAPPPCLGRW